MTKIKILWNYLVGLAGVAALTSTLVFPLTTSAGEILYGATGSQGVTSVLYQIDKTTGAGTAIGSIGFNVSGIAFDPTSGILYGLSGNADAGPAELVTINTTTGAGTLVGTVTGAVTDAFPDITFDAAGNLYAWTENGDRLVKIDKATAAVTFVGPPVGSGRTGLAFSHAGILYLEVSGSLRIIDPVTGALVTTISGLGPNVGVGMDFDRERRPLRPRTARVGGHRRPQSSDGQHRQRRYHHYRRHGVGLGCACFRDRHSNGTYPCLPPRVRPQCKSGRTVSR